MVKWKRGAKGYNIPKFSELGKNKLSPGQTDRQVDAGGRKLNLRRDLRCVVIAIYFLTSTRESQKKNSRQTYLVSHWLIIG